MFLCLGQRKHKVSITIYIDIKKNIMKIYLGTIDRHHIYMIYIWYKEATENVEWQNGANGGGGW